MSGRGVVGAGRGAAVTRRGVWFRRWYGEGPLQLLLLLASFALAGYAGVRLLGDDWVGVTAWFVGAALVHDLLLVPVYGVVDRVVCGLASGRLRASRGGPRGPQTPGRVPVAYVRVPAALSGLLLLVWFPLIAGQVPRYASATGLPADVFLTRWLLLSAALFAGSAVCFVVRTVRGRRSATK